MPVYTMIGNTLYANGISLGHVFDALKNDGKIHADVKAVFDTALIEQAAVTDAMRKSAAQDVLDAQADRDAKVAEAQAQADALGTKDEAQAIRKAQAIAKLQASIADQQAQLKAMT